MILDILIILIIAAAGILGYRKGFVHTLIHSVGWAISLVFAYLLTPGGCDYAKDRTGLYPWIHTIVEKKCDVSMSAIDTMTNSLPPGIAPAVEGYSSDIVGGIADQVTNIFATILVFAALFVIFKLIFFFFQLRFSKDYNDGFVNFADGLFGMLFGFFKGFLLVLVLLAAMLPLINMLSTGLTELLTEQLAASHIASLLYDDNLILMLLNSYMK